MPEAEREIRRGLADSGLLGRPPFNYNSPDGIESYRSHLAMSHCHHMLNEPEMPAEELRLAEEVKPGGGLAAPSIAGRPWRQSSPTYVSACAILFTRLLTLKNRCGSLQRHGLTSPEHDTVFRRTAVNAGDMHAGNSDILKPIGLNPDYRRLRFGFNAFTVRLSRQRSR